MAKEGEQVRGEEGAHEFQRGRMTEDPPVLQALKGRILGVLLAVLGSGAAFCRGARGRAQPV